MLAGLTFAVVAAAQPPSGVVHPETEAGTSPRELGAELFAGNCASCHGSRGQGITVPVPNSGAGEITGQGPDLRGVGALAPDFYLRTGRMPLGSPTEVPQRHEPAFNNREIRGLVAYIASLGKGPPIPKPKPQRASLSHGLELFTDHCAGCHQVVGEGGYVTDTKVPVLQHATATQIAEAVRIGPYLMPKFSRKAISDDDRQPPPDQPQDPHDGAPEHLHEALIREPMIPHTPTSTTAATSHATNPSGTGPMCPMPSPPRSSGARVERT